MNFILRRNKIVLFILPAFYLLTAGVYLIRWIPFYIGGPDPVYAYLFNGMTLATGKIEVGHTDHPGTPIQCFAAIVIFIKHLFNYGIPLYKDVILHPESYLRTICTVISLLFVFTTWYTGWYIFKRTGKLILALLFQLTPLLGSNVMYAQNPQPESFLIMAGMLFIAYVYYESVYKTIHGLAKPGLKQLILYGLFTGLLIASKFTSAPLMLLVLFLLPSFRLRISYILLSLLFFMFFISPAYLSWNKMFEWVYSLATHTGIYGQGATGIIDPVEFKAHLVDIFKEDFYFTAIYIALVAALLVAIIKRKKTALENRIYLPLLSGTWLSCTILIFLVAKHYSFHYVLPIKLCFPLILAGSYEVFAHILNIKGLQNKSRNMVLFYCFTGILIIGGIKDTWPHFSRTVSPSVTNTLKRYPAEPRIISADYQAAFIEPSLDFGTRYTASSHYKYWEFLKKIYPYSYLYKQNQGIITYWDGIRYTPELFAKYPKLIVYFYSNPRDERDSILNNFCTWNHTIKLADNRLIYANPVTDEYMYELSDYQNTSKTLLTDSIETDFDFEKLSADKSNFISTDGTHFLKTGNSLVIGEQHHSGNASILLNEKNPYTAAYPIKSVPGSIIKVSVWRKSDDRKSNIILTSSSDGDFYNSGQEVIDSGADGWQKIQYECMLPAYLKDSTVAFYLYYYGHGSAYFDDLSIKVYPMQLNNSTFVKKD